MPYWFDLDGSIILVRLGWFDNYFGTAFEVLYVVLLSHALIEPMITHACSAK